MGGRGGRASPLSIPLRCRRGGRAGARLCSDGLGEQEKTTVRGLDHWAGSVARPGGRGNPLFIVLLVFNVF